MNVRRLTRRSRTSSGGSLPTASAACARRSSGSISAVFSAWRSLRPKAASWMYGRREATPSAPSEAAAAAIARSLPATAAVAASSCARSVCRWSASGATVAPPRSISPTSSVDQRERRGVDVRGARCRRRRAARAPPAASAAGRRSARRARARRTAARRRAARARRRRRPSCRAVTTSSVGTPALAASSVTKASCSTAWPRLSPSSGPPSRYMTLRQSLAKSWLS